ncbi:MAG: DUF3794 domain-containing protein [Oscillospiraceae bacterium]|jgi:hypothetical protein|nr:DUF3794 domain-containing protein [Oscillospiraceae bacterium]
MELTLKKKNLGLYYKQADSGVTHEESSEMIVPDSLPDVGRIIDTDGTALLRSKECSDGKITVGGIVRTNIAYEPEGGGTVRTLAAQIPFSTVILAANATHDSKVVANTRVSNVNATILNSRKLQITPEILVNAGAYCPAEIAISNAPDDADDQNQIEVLTSTIELNPITDVRERNFNISDECQLSSGAPMIGTLVHSSVDLQQDEYRVAGAKLIVKGTAVIKLVYIPADSIIPYSEDISVPFSEVIDMADGEDNENKTFDITLVPTGIYVQEQGGDYAKSVSVEIPATVQVLVWKKITANYVADAYSTVAETENATETHQVLCLDSEQTLKDTVRETLHTTGTPTSIICARVYPCETVRAADGYGVSFRVCVTYCTEEGRTHTTSEKLQAFFAYPGLPSIDNITAEPYFGDAYATAAAGGIEVRIPVDLKVKIFSTREINPVSSVMVNEDSVKCNADAPSLTIIKVGSEDTLWTLAKRYNSTRKLICEANSLCDTGSVAAGDVLIVAKRRG